MFLLIDSLYVHPSSHAIHYKKCIIPSSFHRSITTLDETIHCKHCEYLNIPDSFTSASVDGPDPVNRMKCPRTFSLVRFMDAQRMITRAGCYAEITAINSGNTVVHHQPTWISSLTYWLFPMLPLTPSKVLASSASTGI